MCVSVCVCVCVCVYLCVVVTQLSAETILSISFKFDIQDSLENISRYFFSFTQKNYFFLKMVLTILIKYCDFKVHTVRILIKYYRFFPQTSLKLNIYIYIYIGCPKITDNAQYVVRDGKLIIFQDGTPPEPHGWGDVEHRSARSACSQYKPNMCSTSLQSLRGLVQ